MRIVFNLNAKLTNIELILLMNEAAKPYDRKKEVLNCFQIIRIYCYNIWTLRLNETRKI